MYLSKFQISFRVRFLLDTLPPLHSLGLLMKSCSGKGVGFSILTPAPFLVLPLSPPGHLLVLPELK